MDRLERLEFMKGEVDHYILERSLPLIVSRYSKFDLGDSLRYSFPLLDSSVSQFDGLLDAAKYSQFPLCANRSFGLEKLFLARHFFKINSIPYKMSVRDGECNMHISATPSQFRLLRYSFESIHCSKVRELYGGFLSFLTDVKS